MFKPKLDIFINGEIIDLGIPNLNFVKKSNWFKYLNSKKNTKFLNYGIFPNTINNQIDFFENSKKDNRIILIILNKLKEFIGIINLSSIDFEKSSAEIALILNQDKKIGPVASNFLSALEAISLMTIHGFEELGLKRISAGQSIKLDRWQNLMELTGYKLEGINKKKFVKGRQIEDSIMISCLLEDYLVLKKRRGKLWDNSEKMLERIKKLPKDKSINKFMKLINDLNDSYYKDIFKL